MSHRETRRHGSAQPRPGRAAIVAVVLAITVVACGSDEAPVLRGMIREPYPDVSTVALPDATNGEAPFVTTAQPGGLLMVYFGYTYCPDICPTTLADLRKALQALGDDADRIDVAMVSVDPFRDTPEVLASYIQAFFPAGHALRTDDQDLLLEAAMAFGAGYEVTIDAEGEIEVAHTALLYAVDPDGHILVQWPFGTPSEDITYDIQLLLERGV